MNIKRGDSMDKTGIKHLSLLVPSIFISVMIYILLKYISNFDFVLFHSVAELITVFAYLLIFIFSINLWRYVKENRFVIVLSIGFLFVAVIDIIHIMSYEGLNYFPNYDSNLPAQLWILGRLVNAFTLLYASYILLTKKRIYIVRLVIVYVAVTVFSFLSIFVFDIFPTMYIMGVGLTPLKIVLEYVIIAILLASFGIIGTKLEDKSIVLKIWLFSFILFAIVSEFFFTQFALLYDDFNFLGHYFKVLSVISFTVFIVLLSLRSQMKYFDNKLLASNESIEKIKMVDQLTGFWNKAKLISDFTEKSTVQIAIAIIDVNGFRLINEAFGFNKGNDLLIKLSLIISKYTDLNSKKYRIDGDSFVLVFEERYFDNMVSSVGRIRDEFEKQDYNGLQLNLSSGMSSIKGSSDLSEMFFEAERNLAINKTGEKNSKSYSNIRVIQNTLFVKSKETQIHSTKVAKIAKVFGELIGFTRDEISNIESISLLHDIGKIGISEHLLTKPSKLSIEEYKEIKKHPEIGYRLIKPVSELKGFGEIILYHHEKWDGTGYPRGIKGEEIPFLSRFIALCDAYDAMTSIRPYKNEMSPDDALLEIIKNKGTQFDPNLVDQFVENHEVIFSKLKV